MSGVRRPNKLRGGGSLQILHLAECGLLQLHPCRMKLFSIRLKENIYGIRRVLVCLKRLASCGHNLKFPCDNQFHLSVAFVPANCCFKGMI